MKRLLFLIAAICLSASALAQNYPDRAVRVIVPFSPGGVTDIIARTAAAKLAEVWSQPVVVENRPGAGGSVGAALVAKAPADGYMLLVHSSGYAINAAINPLTAILRGSHPGWYSHYTNRLTLDRRHAREYTPSEIAQLLLDSGFLAVHIETGPYAKQALYPDWAAEAAQRAGLAKELRGDCIFAVGRKAAIPRTRYPSWLYDI